MNAFSISLIHKLCTIYAYLYLHTYIIYIKINLHPSIRHPNKCYITTISLSLLTLIVSDTRQQVHLTL